MSGDPFEAAMLAGAVRALRRRSERQLKIAECWTVSGPHGVLIKSGEAIIAERLRRGA